MYAQIEESHSFYQGDILRDTPFFIIPKSFTETENGILQQNETVMILSQTCDIERRDFLIVARVISVNFLKKDIGVGDNYHESLKKRKVKYYFYLPADNDFEESCVDFGQIIYIPKKALNKSNRIKSLSDIGRHWLAYQLTDYFGRPFDPNS